MLAERHASSPQVQKLISTYLLMKSRTRKGLLFTSSTVAAYMLVTNLHPDIFHLLGVGIITMISTLSVYLMNDLVDIKIDKINAPTRPLVSGAVKKEEAVIIIASLALTAIMISLMINTITTLLVVAYLIIGIMYSVPKIALKDKSFLKTASIALGGCITSLIGSSGAGVFDMHSATAALTFMVFLFVTSPINDLADYTGDKKHGKKTIPIVFGKRKTILVTMILPFLLAGIFWYYSTALNFDYFTPISMTILASITFRVLLSVYKNRDDCKYVRGKHKKMLWLHYGVQCALLTGLI
jgi:geranylgeranylglycerol-phosphate geranylgeranyltransferase